MLIKSFIVTTIIAVSVTSLPSNAGSRNDQGLIGDPKAEISHQLNQLDKAARKALTHELARQIQLSTRTMLPRLDLRQVNAKLTPAQPLSTKSNRTQD